MGRIGVRKRKHSRRHATEAERGPRHNISTRAWFQSPELSSGRKAALHTYRRAPARNRIRARRTGPGPYAGERWNTYESQTS